MPSPKDQRERLAALGRVLRRSIATPSDTMVTGDLPLLLTKLSQVKREKDD